MFKSYDITIIPNSYHISDVDFYKYAFNQKEGLIPRSLLRNKLSEAGANTLQLAARKFITKNKIIIVYPCEQVTNHNLPDFYDYSESNKVKKLPYLCWGKDYYNWISSLGYDTSNMYITGAIQLDFCRKEFKPFYLERNEMAKRYGLDREKNRCCLFLILFS